MDGGRPSRAEMSNMWPVQNTPMCSPRYIFCSSLTVSLPYVYMINQSSLSSFKVITYSNKSDGRQYANTYVSKYGEYSGKLCERKVRELEQSLKKHQRVFQRVHQASDAAVWASYRICSNTLNMDHVMDVVIKASMSYVHKV